MVLIAKKDFNLELDKYIENRRKPDRISDEWFLTNFGRKISNTNYKGKGKKVVTGIKSIFRRRIPSEEEIEAKRRMRDKKEEEFHELEDELEEVQEAEDKLEEVREGILKRFFKKLRLYNPKKEYAEEEMDGEIVEETPSPELKNAKEALKILHKWIERLPRDELDRFKRSEDFEKYKKALKDLKMIKE